MICNVKARHLTWFLLFIQLTSSGNVLMQVPEGKKRIGFFFLGEKKSAHRPVTTYRKVSKKNCSHLNFPFHYFFFFLFIAMNSFELVYRYGTSYGFTLDSFKFPKNKTQWLENTIKTPFSTTNYCYFRLVCRGLCVFFFCWCAMIFFRTFYFTYSLHFTSCTRHGITVQCS